MLFTWTKRALLILPLALAACTGTPQYDAVLHFSEPVDATNWEYIK